MFQYFVILNSNFHVTIDACWFSSFHTVFSSIFFFHHHPARLERIKMKPCRYFSFRTHFLMFTQTSIKIFSLECENWIHVKSDEKQRSWFHIFSNKMCTNLAFEKVFSILLMNLWNIEEICLVYKWWWNRSKLLL